MARVPTSTTNELEGLLGPRGSLSVSSHNRALVQKWLTASGVKALVAKDLGLARLADAYNDISDLTLAQLQDTSSAAELPSPYVQQYTPVSSYTDPDPENAIQNALATLTKAITAQQKPGAPALDHAQITKIAQDAVKDLIARPIQITIKDTKTDIPAGEVRHNQFEKILKSITCGNVAIVGPAGSGKTTIAEQCAKALNIPFYFTGAISSEYKLTGFIDAHGVLYRTAFREAYEHGGLFLYDEIDASQPSAVLAFNAALANGHADFPDKSIPKHKDFYCMAAANTYWTGADRVYVGRNQLDGATLDRFIFIELDYDEKMERQLAGNDNWVDKVQALRKAAKEQKARVIISPRASIMGAKLLAQGFNESTVSDMTMFKGMDKDAKRKLLDAVGGI